MYDMKANHFEFVSVRLLTLKTVSLVLKIGKNRSKIKYYYKK